MATAATTASTFSNANAEDPQRSIPISSNGQSPFSAGFILDGANDKDGFIGEIVVNPPLDSIQELKFINQNYDAEFGAAVAGVTVMQTKSGTNSFHGSVYDYRHSDAQQARDLAKEFRIARPQCLGGCLVESQPLPPGIALAVGVFRRVK